MGIIALAKGFKNIKKKYKKKSFKLQLMRHIVHIYIYICIDFDVGKKCPSVHTRLNTPPHTPKKKKKHFLTKKQV